MTFRELEAWRAKHNVPDAWWVSVAGTVQPTTFSLAEALQIKSQSQDLHVAVLNNIYVNTPNPSWVDLTLQQVKLAGVELAPKSAEPAKETAAAIPADFLEKFKALVAEVDTLSREVIALRKIADTYKDSFAEAKAILDEREAFLEMSEGQLFEKAQKQEVRAAELDQIRENLDRREMLLKAREA